MLGQAGHIQEALRITRAGTCKALPTTDKHCLVWIQRKNNRGGWGKRRDSKMREQRKIIALNHCWGNAPRKVSQGAGTWELPASLHRARGRAGAGWWLQEDHQGRSRNQAPLGLGGPWAAAPRDRSPLPA